MVNLTNTRNMAGIILAMLLTLSSFAQSYSNRSIYDDYRKWGIVFGPTMYSKAKIEPRYGDYTFENLAIPSLMFGVEYDFFPGEKWSFKTGFLCAYEPVYNISFSIKKEDLFPNSSNDIFFKANSYIQGTIYKIPATIHFNISTSAKSHLSLLAGYEAKSIPYGDDDLVVAIVSEELQQTREVFGLKLVSQKNSVQGSFVSGAGFAYATGWGLLKANLTYVINFQNTIEGEYQIANLEVSPDTRGKYTLSGNYLRLLFSFHFKKKAKLGSED